MSVISDTGPLISIFQSNSLSDIITLVGQIYITPICVVELQKHGYGKELTEVGSSIVA